MATDYAPLWHWIGERERIRVRKECGKSPPWTIDPILGEYRFCNVRREDDRVTRWIAQQVRAPFADHPLLWFMLCICRQINWPDALAELIATEGAWPSHADFSPRTLGEVLTARRGRGDKVYTGAYVVPAPATHGASKQVHIAEVVLGGPYRRALGTRPPVLEGPDASLRKVHAWLCESSGWGPFLAYQAVVDMRFCDRLLAAAPDRHEWAAAGPGTLRGLNRVHGRDVGTSLSQAQALDEMRAIYTIAERETGVAMDFSDVPNVLCETDKYLRVARDEGRPRAKYVPGRGA